MAKYIDNVQFTPTNETVPIRDSLAQENIVALQKQVNGLLSVPPVFVAGVGEMTDVNKIYVLKNNGHIYYYNGTSFVDSNLIYGQTADTFTYKGSIRGTNVTLSQHTDGGWFSVSGVSGTTDLPESWGTESFLLLNFPNSNGTSCGQLILGVNSKIAFRYGGGKPINFNPWVVFKESSDLESLSLLACGDSIVRGVYSTSPSQTGTTNTSMLWTANKFLGFNVKNAAIAGTGYLYRSAGNDENNVLEVLQSYGANLANYDVIFIMAGVNDWHANQPIGSTDSPAANTFSYNVKKCIETIAENAPESVLIIATPLNNNYDGNYTFDTKYAINHPNHNGNTLDDFVDIIRYWCEYYGVSLLDFTGNISPITLYNIEEMLPDGIHPSLKCHELLGRVLADRINIK